MKTRPIQDLVPHPKIAHLAGRWQPDSPEMLALRRSIIEHGILQPLIVTPTGYILDGVTRWMAAKAIQMEAVPVEERPEEEALEIILTSELQRRHQTKGQLAFRLAPLIAEVADISTQRKRANLCQQNKKSSGSTLSVLSRKLGVFGENPTLDSVAATLGVSATLIDQALELHRLFDRYPEPYEWSDQALAEVGRPPGTPMTLREYYTARILDSEHPIGLGGALAGLKAKLEMLERQQKHGLAHGGGRPPRGVKDPDCPRQLVLFREAWDRLKRRWEYWNELDELERAAAGFVIMDALAAAPEDLLLSIKAGIEKTLRERKRNP